MNSQCPNTDNGKHQYENGGNEGGATILICRACGHQTEIRP